MNTNNFEKIKLALVQIFHLGIRSLNGRTNFKQEPITRSVIVRYILPSALSQNGLFLDPDFPRKAVTMMTATKAKNMADKLLARSTISWSDVIKSKNRHFCDCADGQTQYGRITLLVMGSCFKLITEIESTNQNARNVMLVVMWTRLTISEDFPRFPKYFQRFFDDESWLFELVSRQCSCKVSHF